MAQRQPSSVEEIWKIIVDEVTKCVRDDSPNDSVLAQYLGKDIANTYRVSRIQYKKHQAVNDTFYIIENMSFKFPYSISGVHHITDRDVPTKTSKGKSQ